MLSQCACLACLIKCLWFLSFFISSSLIFVRYCIYSDSNVHQQVKKKIKSQAFLRVSYVICKVPDGVVTLGRCLLGIKIYFNFTSSGIKKKSKSFFGSSNRKFSSLWLRIAKGFILCGWG